MYLRTAPCLRSNSKMTLLNGELSTEQLLEAQVLIWNHAFAFINSMSLKCALQLGIPDAIHRHGGPITLSDLLHSLPIPKSKSHFIHRLMRLLVHSKFFAEADGRYWLTPASRLLLRDPPLTEAPLAQLILDPVLTEPWLNMSEWLADERPAATPFETVHGATFWEKVGNEHPSLCGLFNGAMASDSRLVARVLVGGYKHVFDGIRVLVDVAGGTGTMARAIAGAFPSMKCVVLDLPHVVSGMEGTHNLRYVGGDMFQSIPPADAVLLKWILHDWNDEECLKILKRCREAIPSKDEGGKVVVIDMVVDVDGGDDKVVADQLFFDMCMMSLFNAKERTEKEWAKLFSEAGFSGYNITPAFGLRSLIEVYP